MNGQRQEWQKAGAALRLHELDVERNAILRTYPELGRNKPKKGKSRLSAKQRKAQSIRMKARWAKWRKANGKA